MVLDVILFIVLPVLFCVVLTYYLWQREQFKVALEVFTLITNLFIGGKMSKDVYIEKREEAYNNLSWLQKYWFEKMKRGEDK